MLAGCDRGTPETQAIDAPPVKVTEILVATGVTVDGYPDPATYTSIKDAPINNALATTSVKVRFDRFLLPANTFRQSLCVQSDLKVVKSLRDCSAARVFFEPSYDPVHRELILRQSADPTTQHMVPGVTYRVTLFPPDATGGNGISAFDGAPLDAVTTFDFATSATLPATAKVEPLPTDDFFCKTAYPALTNCAKSACHLDKYASGELGAAMGLDLSTPALIARTAVGHVAHGTQEGEQAKMGDRSPLRFGRAMPIVDPGFPGNSYLLYKLLVNENNGHIDAGPLPDPFLDTPSEGEIARLRASVVVGMPMPPSKEDGALVQTATVFEALSGWILQGAPTPSCP